MDEQMGHEMLVARLREAELDAKRYRWLCSWGFVRSPSLWDGGVGFFAPMPKFERSNVESLNAAIDAAIKAEEAAQAELRG